MKILLMRIAVFFFRIMYLPFLPIVLKDKVTILSRQSDKPTVDIQLLSSAFHERGIHTVALTKRLNKSIAGAAKYGLHMIRQMYHISTSKLLVVDGYCILASVLHKKDGQKIVQIWHSLGAIKKFGYQSVEKDAGNDARVVKVMKLHDHYDYVIAPSKVTAGYYSQAFNMPEEKIKLYGLPRIDYILDKDDEIIKKMKELYPQLLEKENVLYAPTFRKNRAVDINEMIKSARLDRYNLIIKKHWLDKSDYSEAERHGVTVAERFSFIEWLKLCNKVITDYSATAFEAAVLGKELFFYIKDVDEYEKSIGLNMDFDEEEIRQYVFRDAEKLWDAIEEDYDISKVANFRKKYVAVDTQNCTSRLVDFLASLIYKNGNAQ